MRLYLKEKKQGEIYSELQENIELKNTKGLTGLNVTIPYKEQVIKYLDEIDGFAKKIGAVNVIKIKDGKSQ